MTLRHLDVQQITSPCFPFFYEGSKVPLLSGQLCKHWIQQVLRSCCVAGSELFSVLLLLLCSMRERGQRIIDPSQKTQQQGQAVTLHPHSLYLHGLEKASQPCDL